VLVAPSGLAKLAELGLRTEAQDDLAALQVLREKPYFRAPEQMRAQWFEGRGDLYSLGATLYYLLAGLPPFEGDTPYDVKRRLLSEAPSPELLQRAHVSKPTIELIMKLLEKLRENRPADAATVAADLRRIAMRLGPAEKGATEGAWDRILGG
jgi:serine/threonine-protein kinase